MFQPDFRVPGPSESCCPMHYTSEQAKQLMEWCMHDESEDTDNDRNSIRVTQNLEIRNKT